MAEKAASKERKLTRYQVFIVGEGGAWTLLGETEAHNGSAAIAATATVPGNYRAVPTSNITEQPMGYPPPPPQKLVPVTQLGMDAAEQIQDALDAADPPHSAAGGSLRAVDPVEGQEALS